MLIRRPHDVPPSEITPKSVFAQRHFLQFAAGGALSLALPAAHAGDKLPIAARSPLSTDEEPTPYRHIAGYNNFVEFGNGKEVPAERAHRLRTAPWSVTLDGLVHKPRTLAIEDILKLAPLEDRVYRLRCVEGWSMVVPWVGFSPGTSRSNRSCSPTPSLASASRCSTGLTPRGCASTKPCIR